MSISSNALPAWYLRFRAANAAFAFSLEGLGQPLVETDGSVTFSSESWTLLAICFASSDLVSPSEDLDTSTQSSQTPTIVVPSSE